MFISTCAQHFSLKTNSLQDVNRIDLMTLLGLLLKKMRCFMNMLTATPGIFGFWRITIQLAFYKLESIEDSFRSTCACVSSVEKYVS